jgi:hypothetical protein
VLTRTSRSVVYLVFIFLVADWTQIPSPARAEDRDPYVAFNTRSRIFHHPECDSALACTRNCIRIHRSEAIARHGRPCKHCGGGLRFGRMISRGKDGLLHLCDPAPVFGPTGRPGKSNGRNRVASTTGTIWRSSMNAEAQPLLEHELISSATSDLFEGYHHDVV